MKIRAALTAFLLALTGAATGANLTYMIVVTGSELLQGVYPDGHTQFLTRTLHPLGWRCAGSLSIDDDRTHLLDALQFASAKASVIIVTGGLGPTPNDITRETVAEFTGVNLKENPELLRRLARQLEIAQADLPGNLRRQCLMPEGGKALANPGGTAVGLVFETTGALIVTLPGPPRELHPMVTNELEPLLRERFGTRPPGASVTARFAGVRQSFLDQEIQKHIGPSPDILVSSLFEGDRVDFTFTAPDSSIPHQDQLQRILQLLRAHLGEHLYADDGASLEQVTVDLLIERGAQLVLADAGTGGALAAQLGQVPGVESVLIGAFGAPSETSLGRALQVPPRTWKEWTHGAESIRGLAMAAAAQSSATWAIGVGTSRESTGATGVSNIVSIAIKSPGTSWETFELSTAASGKDLQNSLTTRILNQLRLRLKSKR